MKIRFLGCIYKFCLNWNVERIDERGNEKQWLRGQVKKTKKTTPKCNEGWRHAHAQNTSRWLAQWKTRSEEVTGRLHKRAGSSWRSTLVVLASAPQSSLGAHDGYREGRKGLRDLWPPTSFRESRSRGCFIGLCFRPIFHHKNGFLSKEQFKSH